MDEAKYLADMRRAAELITQARNVLAGTGREDLAEDAEQVYDLIMADVYAAEDNQQDQGQ
jgi:hypothetical protein